MRHASNAALVLFALLGCSPPPPPSEPIVVAESSGAESAPVADPPAAPAAKVAPDSLAGLWVEFWALSGQTETQRYALSEDGSFGWRAAAGTASGVVRRWGRWSADGATLVLSVQGEESAGGCRGTACQARHEPPREERVQVGDCPPNDEAKALDATYRCASIGGRAFWRRGQADDMAAYMPQAAQP